VWEGGTLRNTITPGASARSQAVAVPTSETPYTYRIRAHNKALWGEWSPMSAPRRGVNKPDAPVLSSVTPGDRSLTLGSSPGALNGAKPTEVQYQYSVNGGSSWAAMPGNKIVTGLANGTNYNVRVRAVATVETQTLELDGETLEAMCMERPEIAIRIIRRLAFFGRQEIPDRYMRQLFPVQSQPVAEFRDQLQRVLEDGLDFCIVHRFAQLYPTGAAFGTDVVSFCLFDHRCLGLASRLGEMKLLCLHRYSAKTAAAVGIAHLFHGIVGG